MYLRSWLGRLSLFVSLPIVIQAQTTLSADATSVLPAVNLQPTFVWQSGQAGQSPLMTSSATFLSKAMPAATAIAIANQNVSLAYNIPLQFVEDSETTIRTLCWYPVSGYYGPLSRILFYATMLFAVFARRHQWLIIGALAASMTYAGTAAIHACVIIWSNSGMGNDDCYAILGILIFACAMIVPLLTWSSTVKSIGKTYEEESIGRSIIIAWSFLIFVGFITMFVGLVAGRVSYNHGKQSIHVVSPADSFTEGITCTPPNGILDLTAGQNFNWRAMYVTREFIGYNRCSNPCGKLRYSTILKPVENLIPLTQREVDYWLELYANIRRQDKTVLTLFAILLGGIAMCWSILQSLTIILFGRRSPTQVRNKTYLVFFGLFKRRDAKGKVQELSIKNHYIPHLLAKGIAYSFYAWGVAATLISSFIVIGSIVATELLMHVTPQADSIYEVDQWASWVATGLVLVTAFLYRFEGIFEDCLMRVLNSCLRALRWCFHGNRKTPRKVLPSEKETLVSGKSNNRSILADVFANSVQHYRERFEDMRKMPLGSWQDTKDFWSDSLKTAKKDHGQAHGRRRKVVNLEGQKFPTGWKQDGLDDWLRLEDFVKACRKYDESWRINADNKGHKGYKWQPRIIPDDGVVDALRTEFDSELLTDIFSRNKQKSHSYEAVAAVPGGSDIHLTVSNNSKATDHTNDPESAHGTPILTMTSPLLEPNNSSMLPQITQSQPTVTKITTEVSQVSQLHHAGTAVSTNEDPASQSLLPPTSSTTSPDNPTPIRHASTFPVRQGGHEHPQRRPIAAPSSSVTDSNQASEEPLLSKEEQAQN